MRHPSLLGNKQPQALSELGEGTVWYGGLVPCLAPLFSPRPWMPAQDCWHPRVTGATVAAPGVRMLVVWLWQGVWLFHMSLCPMGSPAQPCLQLGLSLAQDDGGG